MGKRSFTEYVVLGALIPAPKHGYEIMRFLDSALESTWRVSTSQLYVLLKRLQREGLLRSIIETQDARPSKRVFALTDEGEGVFMDWLNTATSPVRDFRAEFLSKLFFFYQYSMPGAGFLARSQIELLKARKDEMRRRLENEDEPYGRLVYGFKVHMVESHLSWLTNQAVPFINSHLKD